MENATNPEEVQALFAKDIRVPGEKKGIDVNKYCKSQEFFTDVVKFMKMTSAFKSQEELMESGLYRHIPIMLDYVDWTQLFIDLGFQIESKANTSLVTTQKPEVTLDSNPTTK